MTDSMILHLEDLEKRYFLNFFNYTNIMMLGSKGILPLT